MDTQEGPQKTFKVHCDSCTQPFFVRFSLANPTAEGTAEVVVTCQYCQQDVLITIPEQYNEQDMFIRGLKSRLRTA